MPDVTVLYDSAQFREVDNLRIACDEIIPAAYNSEGFPLAPGDIDFTAHPKGPSDMLAATVVIHAEASFSEDRAADLKDRGKNIKAALEQLFPGIIFAVWAKLVTAVWCSDTEDEPKADVDMSMDAAVKRADFLLTEIRTTS